MIFEISVVKMNVSVDLQVCNFCRTYVSMLKKSIKYIHIQKYPLSIVVELLYRKINSNFRVEMGI
jgi:hypothetical protein